MLINSYLKNIMDRPSTDINTMTDVTDNGILYIPNEPTYNVLQVDNYRVLILTINIIMMYHLKQVS